MTNIFLGTPVYISVQDVIDSTTNAALKVLPAPGIEVLINKAQAEIDCYLGKTFWPPFEDTQTLLFPVLMDDASYLPTELTQAALYIVEQLFVLGDTVVNGIPYQDLKSEKIGPRAYTYGDKNQDRLGFMIPDIALKLLEKLKNRFAKQFLGPKTTS